PLTDSVFFMSQDYLLELRSVLLGFPAQAHNKILVQHDFRPYLTPIEALAASIPPPKQFGEETIYRLVLREVSAPSFDADLLLISFH
ncbi:MAG TPA: hypothetical protein VKB35_10285, partial [Ktedonobacteraceae bacterium]|nr:hypothetical protein [Ktedonobacteraceae bacterium]